jgi:hypothetical protein
MQVEESRDQSALESPALLHVNQHLLGSGDDTGTWMLELRNALRGERAVLVCTATMIPWFLQAWFHTLLISIDGRPVPLEQVCIPTPQISIESLAPTIGPGAFSPYRVYHSYS